MINGMINIYKEKAYTSHDVVARLRGILQQRKIGHTGTLDPDATGVLPVCLGNATKLCDMLTDKSKEYQVTFQLGFTTDTQDISGVILSEKEIVVTEEQVLEVIQSYIGDYDQIPPMYSALKVNGKRLYQLAREGKEVERKSRKITIEDIKDIKIELPKIEMKVSCSKGTYIRTLCYDIGENLGCGATMTELTRTRVGEFQIENAFTLEQVEALRDSEQLLEQIIKVDSVFDHLKKGIVQPQGRKFLDNGNPLLLNQLTIEGENSLEDKEEIRIYNDELEFCGIYEYIKERDLFMPVKMFHSN